MTAGKWLCIDQGGQSTRAAVLDDRGAVLALGQSALATRVHGGVCVEHAPEALLASVTAALGQVRAALSGSASIEAAAIATQRSTLVCADRATGAALSPIISWQDRRGEPELARLAADHGGRIHELTGLRVSPHYGVGKLRWCLDRLAPVDEARRRGELVAAPLAAFLLRRLGVGGDWQVDPANASRMLLMDVAALDWSQELLDLFGIERRVLPAIRPCRYEYGSLSLAGRDVPLRVCTGDQSAALFCAGTPEPGTVFVNIGTGAFIQCATAAEAVADPALLTSVAWEDGASRMYVLEGTVNGAAAAVEAALDALDLARPGHDALNAALSGLADAPLLYLNGISGLGSPDWRAAFRSRYLGDGSAMQRLAAVYESIVFLILRNLEQMRSRIRLQRIVVTGGLARIDWMAQRLASLSGLPVERPTDPEATLRGLYFLLRDAGAAAPPAPPAIFLPRPEQAGAARYRRWTEALEAALAEPAL